MSRTPEEILKIGARLLLPPDENLKCEVIAYRSSLESFPSPARIRLRSLLDFLESASLETQIEAYHFSFGAHRGSSLYLNEYEGGESQTPRCVRLLSLLYRRNNFNCPPWETPDFLPVVLDFYASSKDQTGIRFATWTQGAMAELRDWLSWIGSPYLGAMETALWALHKVSSEALVGIALSPSLAEEGDRWEVAYANGVLGLTVHTPAQEAARAKA